MDTTPIEPQPAEPAPVKPKDLTHEPGQAPLLDTPPVNHNTLTQHVNTPTLTPSDVNQKALTDGVKLNTFIDQRRVPGPNGGFLIPAVKGTTHNPNGRPAAGLTVVEQHNRMRNWPLHKLQKVIDDPDSAWAQITAARQMIQSAMEPPRVNGPAYDRVMDRTLGRPRSLDEGFGRQERIVFMLDLPAPAPAPIEAQVTQAEAIAAAQPAIGDDPGSSDAQIVEPIAVEPDFDI